MTDPEFDRIIQAQKRKYLPPISAQLFHGGLIFLVSLAIGLLYFQFESMPSGAKLDDVGLLRQGLGVMLGSLLALGGTFFYILWILWRGHKAKKEAMAEILAAALKKLDKK